MCKKENRTRLLFLLFILISTFVSVELINIRSVGFKINPLYAFDWFKSSDELSRLKTLDRVIYYLDQKYLDPTKINHEKMLASALEELEQEIPELIVSDKGATYKKIKVAGKSIKVDSNVHDFPSLKSTLSKALKFIRSHMTSKKSDIELETTAIAGILDTLDPHSILLSPDQYEETKLSTSGRFGGLGIIITIKKTGDLVVISPIDDTPAYRAGIKSGDVIKKIGDESTINMTLNEAVKRMRGEKNTTCVLTIMREGFDEPKIIKIKRDIIVVTSVESHKLNNSVGYIRIKNFQDDTKDNVEKQISSLRARMKSFKGLILDLRSNPGGLLEQAIEVSDLFLKKGPIVTTVGWRKSIRKTERARDKYTQPDYPLIVLVDAGSASASEIVAGAFKNNNRAIIMGKQTFGKGSVQTIYNLPENWALKLTIAEYLTPGDKSIQSFGIMPDIRLVPVSVDTDNMNLFRSERRMREEDLDQHIEKNIKHHEKPSYQVKFLLPPEPKKNRGQDDFIPKDLKKEKFEKLKKDFEVQLASQIIIDSKFSDRELALKSVARTLKESIKSEKDKISKALAKLGIIWENNNKDKPEFENCKPPTANFRINGGSKSIKAGSEIEASITVNNSGKCTLHKLWGISQSDNPFFANREFIFGKILPGSSKKSSLKIKVPQNAIDRLINIKIEFDETFGNLPTSTETSFTIQGLEKPAFAFNYQIVDDGTFGSKGNGNGLIEKKENIAVILSVKNIGRGISEDNLVTLKNLSGKDIFLTRGRSNIGKIKPGEIKDLKFLFQVKEAFDKKDVEFEATVLDITFREYIQDKFKIAVLNEPREATKIKKHVTISENGATIYASPTEKPEILGRLVSYVTLRATAEYKNFFKVALNDDRKGWVMKSQASITNKPLTKQIMGSILYDMSKIPPRLKLASNFAIPLKTGKGKIKVKGKVFDESAIRDMYIFVNGRKIFYDSFNEKNKKQLGYFDVMLKLDDGTNDIAIYARDDEDLVSRSYFYTNRVVPGKKLSENRTKIFKDIN